ncbi:MAG TPA: hypothetical protein P5543_03940 [Planctomycetota bacterium]|nr:hypothetical protein [Planctomycetota bacterium]HRU51324.1 hypothetical protein [Planctomycetota bacterium]
MRKPEITKRMLPLLDIIFLLLAFFIILPHGITSGDKVQISSLKNENAERARKIEYYEWQYSDRKAGKGNIYKTITLQFRSDELYHESTKLLPDKWREYLNKQFNELHINFVFLQIIDTPGIPTLTGSVDQLEQLLNEFNVIHIIQI